MCIRDSNKARGDFLKYEDNRSEMLKKDWVINSQIKNITSALKKTGKGSIHSDVLGSYTGMTQEGYEPVQDADDL